MLFCFLSGDGVKKSLKEKYISSAFLMLASGIVVKIISAVYKIPLTSYIGATGRGYFSLAYNLCLPIHAVTMGAFPIALSKLVSKYNSVNDIDKIKGLRKASDKLFFTVAVCGISLMILLAKPYCDLTASAPKCIYTVLALAPSVFFCCLGAGKRAFAEGFMDMKPTAVCQLIEALFKTVFGLLLAKLTMSRLVDEYLSTSTVLGISYQSEKEALAAVYPLTSAAAMLGVSLGGFAGWIYVSVYVNNKYNYFRCKKAPYEEMYAELKAFAFPLLFAAAVQSVSSFLDNASIQYALTMLDKSLLSRKYNYSGNDVYAYVYGIYSSALDFKNLVPGMVMALGVTAVPAVSSAYESRSPRFSSLINSILKYISIISCFGGVILALFSREILGVFYSNGNPDIVSNASRILFLLGACILPCCLASGCVFCSQSLGLSKQTIAPFAVTAVIRLLLNLFYISNINYNITAAVFSDFAGYLLIAVWNMFVISKKCGCKFSFKDIFLKPILCALITFFSVRMIKERFFSSFSNFEILTICATICVILFIFALLLFKCIKLSDIFNSK